MKKDTKSSEAESSLRIPAAAIDLLQKNPKAEGTGALKALSARFYIRGFQFIDAKGKVVNDALSSDKSQSPKVGAILTRMAQPADQSLYSFKAFAVTPGDLESYTAPAINQKMKDVGYAGEDYVRDVIFKNAYPLTDLDDFPSFTWTLGNTSGEKSSQLKSSFTEQAWKFDGSLYGGVSGGGGIDFFGIGEKFEASLLVGGTYSHDKTEDQLKSSGWSVGISEEWGPPPAPEENCAPDAVSEYSFDMYFLPVPKLSSTLPSNYWTTELLIDSRII